MKKYLLYFTLLFSFFASNKLEANLFIPEHRYTAAAYTQDLAQCTAFILTFNLAYYGSLAACNVACSLLEGNAAQDCADACDVAAMAASVGAGTAASVAFAEFASNIRKNTKVINTSDPEKGECGNLSNYDRSENFILSGDLEYESGNFSTSETLDGGEGLVSGEVVEKGWYTTGPMGNYCYDESLDHNLEDNEDIYNNGKGKIGISYKGNEEVWVEPFDCKFLDIKGDESSSPIPFGAYVCAWEEGDEICAEIALCSGLIVGELGIDAFNGKIGDPVTAESQAKRDCGSDPYTDGEIDDYNDNFRCECLCCEGSRGGLNCENIPERTCQTYNERYRAHCIKSPLVLEDFEPLVDPPATVSASCSMDYEEGYAPFSVTGKAVRCFAKTMENMFFGIEEIQSFDIDGEPIIDALSGNPVFTRQCIDNLGSIEDGCDLGFLNVMQDNLSNLVTIILVLAMSFIAIRFLMGGGMKKNELFVILFQFSLILYFATSSGWRDGYYDFLVKGSYELASDYFKATIDAEKPENIFEEIDDILFAQQNNFEALDNCSYSDAALTFDEDASLAACDFFNGVDYNGNDYSDSDQYYAVLDTLDCKFANYFGISHNQYFPKIIEIGVAYIFTHPVGIPFFFAGLALLASGIILMIKITLMLVISVVMINFLVYLSPVIIPLILLKRTKPIFDKWLVMLIGFSLQPFLVLALTALIILLFDNFYTVYIAPIYDFQITYVPGFLGTTIMTFAQNFVVSHETMMVNILQMLFLLVVVIHVFNKFSAILSQLSGASAMTDFVKMPEGKMIKKAMKAAMKGAKDAAVGGGHAISRELNEASDKAADKKEQKKEKAGSENAAQGGGKEVNKKEGNE